MHVLAEGPVSLERLQCYRQSVTRIFEGVDMPFITVLPAGVAARACAGIATTTDFGAAGVYVA